ncbi:MAG: carboxyltransferase domain-containing protein [Actinobacteria bacterium]|uniref:Unannotated protein n=1 Tax=freshwater metagenome TaxID=449393 RepID=A0A6J6PG80_9ZZZZ|nr:carboxyltransferase domain-containing protein [Actinomycetota bacterium]
MRQRPVGPHALLVEVADAGEALALASWARTAVEAVEVVPAACTVLLDGVADLTRAADAVRGWQPTAERPRGRLVEVPTIYDGPDLVRVAEHWGVDVDEVVRRHTDAELVSSFCGFAPGFAYLDGLGWSVPRLDSPRPRVAPGSVALAGSWCGIYPTASPGGWQLIGRTDLVLWDPTRPDPALLAPGTRVRFVAR